MKTEFESIQETRSDGYPKVKEIKSQKPFKSIPKDPNFDLPYSNLKKPTKMRDYTQFEIRYIKSKIKGISFSLIPDTLKVFWIDYYNALPEEEKNEITLTLTNK